MGFMEVVWDLISPGVVAVGIIVSGSVLGPLEEIEERRAQISVIDLIVVVEEIHGFSSLARLCLVNDSDPDKPTYKFEPVFVALLKDCYLEQEIRCTQIRENQQVGKIVLNDETSHWHEDF